jgi:hypothetical protein
MRFSSKNLDFPLILTAQDKICPAAGRRPEVILKTPFQRYISRKETKSCKLKYHSVPNLDAHLFHKFVF